MKKSRACIGAQLTICAKKWRNFVCSSTLSLRFVWSWVCVFLYSLGPRTYKVDSSMQICYYTCSSLLNTLKQSRCPGALNLPPLIASVCSIQMTHNCIAFERASALPIMAWRINTFHWQRSWFKAKNYGETAQIWLINDLVRASRTSVTHNISDSLLSVSHFRMEMKQLKGGGC